MFNPNTMKCKHKKKKTRIRRDLLEKATKSLGSEYKQPEGAVPEGKTNMQANKSLKMRVKTFTKYI